MQVAKRIVNVSFTADCIHEQAAKMDDIPLHILSSAHYMERPVRPEKPAYRKTGGKPKKRKGKVKSMKNKFKKLLALALFAIMAMAMAVTASATSGTYKVTLKENGEISTNTYDVYQVASFDVSGGKHTNFKLVAPYDTSEVEYVEGKKIKDITADLLAAEQDDSATLQKLAIALADNKGTPVNQEGVNGEISFANSGYYLIVERSHTSGSAWLATRYILVAVDSANQNVDLKTSAATIDKKILENGKRVDANTANFEETITYEIIAKIPNYPENAKNLNYAITDQMSAGLTYTGVSKVEIFSTHDDAADNKDVVEKAYTGYEYGEDSDPVGTNGAKVVIKVPSKDLKLYADKFIKVTITAKLSKDNADVVIGANGNPNSVELTYTNNWTAKEDYTTKPDTVITYTGQLNIVKVDGDDNNTKLLNAIFAIYGPEAAGRGETPATVDGKTIPATIDDLGEAGHYITTVTTDEDGIAYVSGLRAGTYYAVEVKAPEGYNIDSTPQKIMITVEPDGSLKLSETGDPVTIESKGVSAANNESKKYTVTWKNKKDDAEDGADSVTITNKKGTTLPGTGGMGTTIFTIGGIVLVALAALMFVVYMRKQKKQA